jgi:hypothetical protein
MVNDAPTVRSLFEQALELPATVERAAFLDDACAAQPQLRESVEALLQAHADAGSFLATRSPAQRRPQFDAISVGAIQFVIERRNFSLMTAAPAQVVAARHFDFITPG